jgi:hypothetical protein
VPVIRVTAGQREFAAQGRRTEGAIELRHASGLLFVKDVIAAPAIVITETLALPGDAQGSSRVVKFSTTGLPELLGQSQNHCTGGETIDRPTTSGGG